MTHAPKKAPDFPAAAETPWSVALAWDGKISPGMTYVVRFGPKFEKKNVRP